MEGLLGTMNVYLAGVGIMEPYFRRGELAAGECSVLCSYYGISDFEGEYLPKFKRVLIDSGAFTFLRGGKTVEWEKYVDGYAKWIVEHDVKLFFELDVDLIVGLPKTEELRDRLHQRTGRASIPVWHKCRGKEYFLKMCEEYPYVALGGVVTKEIPRNKFEGAFPWFINEAHKRGTKIHGLGYTSIEGLNKYRFDSVDSTTWNVGAKFGEKCRLMPNRSWREHFSGKRVSNGSRLAYYNFNEWLRFQQYAEKHL